MFSIIDNWIITIFRWTIRQLELYSPVTRKKILAVIFFGILLLTAFRTYVGTQLMATSPLVGIWIAFGFVVTLPYVFTLYLLSQKSHGENILPGEIETRKYSRATGIASATCGWLVIYFSYWSHVVLRDQEDVLMFWCVKTLCCEICLVVLIEYLLCTSSLPPGEKERRKQVRLEKDAVPVGA